MLIRFSELPIALGAVLIDAGGHRRFESEGIRHDAD